VSATGDGAVSSAPFDSSSTLLPPVPELEAGWRSSEAHEARANPKKNVDINQIIECLIMLNLAALAASVRSCPRRTLLIYSNILLNTYLQIHFGKRAKPGKRGCVFVTVLGSLGEMRQTGLESGED
jgi:hypothetical protein